jgi:rhomboid protease GluP
MDSSPPRSQDPAPPIAASAEVTQARAWFGALFAATPRAVLTWTLIAANAAVFVAMALESSGEAWRLLTATFVHIGYIHLLVNMYCLKVMGPLVERFLGHAGFLVLYLVAGLSGSVANQITSPPDVVSAGASGSIFGLFGAVVGYSWRVRSSMPVPVRKSLVRTTLMNVALNLLLVGFLVPNVNNSAHVGGLVGGFLSAFALAGPPTPESIRKRGRRAIAVAVVSLAVLAAALAVVWNQPLPSGRGVPPR